MKKYRKSSENNTGIQNMYRTGEESVYDEQNTNIPDTDESGYERREGFIQSHIRIITFICCTVVFICVAVAWLLFRDSNQIKGETNKSDITMLNVYGISEKKADITWADFALYNYNDQSYSEAVKREYKIADSDYVVWVGGKNTEGKPEYVYLINMSTSQHIDLTNDDPRDFVE